jgi:hypothetical protein
MWTLISEVLLVFPSLEANCSKYFCFRRSKNLSAGTNGENCISDVRFLRVSGLLPDTDRQKFDVDDNGKLEATGRHLKLRPTINFDLAKGRNILVFSENDSHRNC